MISLTKRLRQEAEAEAEAAASSPATSGPSPSSTATSGSSPSSTAASTNNNRVVRKRASIRDKLLVKEVQEMESELPAGCKVKFDDPNALHDFVLTISPDDPASYWHGGKFRFHVLVGDEYNMCPPTVRCQTKIWHPNINEDGAVCLSILRQNSIDGMGWAPTRKLKDVLWGLSSLLGGDLLNFEDPLNIEAADHYVNDREAFRAKVREWVAKFAKR